MSDTIHPVVAANPHIKHVVGNYFAEVSTYKGFTHVDIREWFKPEDSAEWVRTKKGIRVDVRDFHRLTELAAWIAEEAKKA